MKKVIGTIAMIWMALNVQAQSPGGVSGNLSLWLKANAGTNTTTNGSDVTSWADQAGSNNATETNNPPSFLSVAINFNPAIEFDDGDDEQMSGSGGFYSTAYYMVVNPNNSLTSTSEEEVLIGFDIPGSISSRFAGLILGAATAAFSGEIITHAIGGTGTRWRRGISQNQFGTIVSGETYLFAVKDNATSGATSTEMFVNGLEQADLIEAGGTFLTSSNVNYKLARYEHRDGNNHFNGQIAEVISYSVRPTDAEHTRIQSYLALKYGITLDTTGGGTAGDLVNSGSTTLWDASANSAYHSDVAGIGRDDNSSLNQKQSASVNASSLLTVGLGTIATSNAANTDTFSADNSFMLWGHNNGSVAFSSTGAPAGKEILDRVWKVQETGTVDSVWIQVPASSSSASVKLPDVGDAGSVSLVVDADGDFSNGARVIDMTLNGTNWETQVDLADGQYFSFMRNGAVLSVSTNGDEEGPVNIVYTVSLPEVNNSGSTITFDIDDAATGSATSGSDYTAVGSSDQIGVAHGSQTGTYTVSVIDDAAFESIETINLTISNPSDASLLVESATATANIKDNDGKSPGGVLSGLVFWLMANKGTDNPTNGGAITSWIDQSGNSNDGFDIEDNDPRYASVVSSYNPALDYTSTSASGGIGLADDPSINTAASSAKAYTMVFQTGSDVTTRQVLFEEGGGTHGMNLYIENGSLIANLWQSSADRTITYTLSTHTDYIVTFVYDGANTRTDLYVNGTLEGSNTSATSSLSAHSNNTGIGVISGGTQFDGDRNVSGDNGFSGYIMEMAYYNAVVLGSPERARIESYLALKYGIDIDSDLTASDGTTTFWDESAYSGYTNQVTALGSDDNSGLYQKQALNVAGMVSIGLDSIATDNASNSGSFSADYSFLAWGNNAGTLSFSTTGSPPGKTILGRVWRVQETGTIGTVEVKVPDNSATAAVKIPQSGQLYLAVDADGDFSSGASITTMVLNGTYWEADVDFTNGDYFTFLGDGAALSVTTQGDEDGPVDIVYTVTLPYTNSSGSAITFDLDDAGTGTALSGSDYTAIPGSARISVASGSQTGTYTVPVIDDAIPEGTETVTATISNASLGSIAITTPSATAIITDNEPNDPGGVSSGLSLWLKADAGTNTTINGADVTTWADQAGANNATENDDPPSYVSAAINFNPAVHFEESNDEQISGTAGFYSMAYYMVINPDDNLNSASTEQALLGFDIPSSISSDFAGLVLGSVTSAFSDEMITHSIGGIGTRWRRGISETRLGSIVSGETYLLAVKDNAVTNATSTEMSVNGLEQADLIESGGTFLTSSNVDYELASYTATNDFSTTAHFDGQIAEVISYSTRPTDAEHERIESYLALKYGLTLKHDYVASDGTTYWDTTTNSGYNNAITAIGQDVISGLNQKQSKSALSGALLTIGLDTIVADNVSNNSAFAADLSFLALGQNEGAVSFTATGAPAGGLVLERKWKVQETGTVGKVKIQVPSSTSSAGTKLPAAGTLQLILDSDGDFSTGYTTVPMTLNGTNWEAKADFSDGQYFSFLYSEAVLSVTTQGNESGPVNMVYTVTLTATNASGSAITFDVNDLGAGTATSGSDYTAVPTNAKISVADGAQSGTYTVTVLDDNFDETDETVTLGISNPSVSGILLTTNSATATIMDDDVSAPGGVSANLAFWLKANAGTPTNTNGDPVTGWVDQTSNSNSALRIAISSMPAYASNAANFNPGIDFTDGSGNATDGLYIANDEAVNTKSGGYTAKSYIVSFKTGSDVSTLQVLYEQGGDENGMNLYINGSMLYANLWNNSTEDVSSTAVLANTVYVVTFVFDGNNNRWDLYVNGALATSVTNSSNSSLNADSDGIGLGVVYDNTQFSGGVDVSSGNGFLGTILEMIYYSDKVFTTAERNQLESYLAIKYGLTLSTDYTASDGSTVVWDASANAGYNNDIAGIAGDGTSILEQKQSASVNEDALVTIGLGSIASDNVSNGGAFAAGEEFLIWGNNSGTLSGATSNSGLPTQSGVVDQLQRGWKIVGKGTIGTIQLAFSKDSIDDYLPYAGTYGNLYLRVSDNAAFTTNVVDSPLTAITINSEHSYATTYNFSGTKYFTVVQKDFILWTGTEWRGGLSSTVTHAPSSNAGDAHKTMYILSGDTAKITGGVAIASVEIASTAVLNLEPASCLNLSNTITNSGSLLLEANSTGYAQYKGPAVRAIFQQYVDNGGWHLIGSPFSNTNWDSISFKANNGFINHPLNGLSQDSCDYCNLWYYDAGTDNGENIGFGSTNAYGTWRSSTGGTQSFTPNRGWNLYLDSASGFATAPWTLIARGTFNHGNINQTVNENNGGWNLVANPYPSVLDWNVVDDDLSTAGIAGGYHIWDHENTNYATYASGIGTLGATGYIAPFQGFFIQTSTKGGQNSGNVYRTFSLTNDDRPDGCQGTNVFYKTATSENRIVIRTKHTQSGKVDETVISLDEDAMRAFDEDEDIRKLFTRYADAPSVYSVSTGERLSINRIFPPVWKDSLQLGIRAAEGSNISISAVYIPEMYTVYLEDILSGRWYSIAEKPLVFTHHQDFSKRFWLHFGPRSFDPSPWEESKPFYIYQKEGKLIVKTRKSIQEGSWYVATASGQMIRTGSIEEGSGQVHTCDVSQLAKGVYVFVLLTAEKSYTEKFVKAE